MSNNKPNSPPLSILDKFYEFADSQRIERLNGCQTFEQNYQQCCKEKGKQEGCHAEIHAMWACRATGTFYPVTAHLPKHGILLTVSISVQAMGCGNALQELNSCFKESSKNSNKRGCKEEQQKVGQCVKINVKALEDRRRQRQSQ